MKRCSQVALLAICIFLSGCVGVTRVPQRTRGQQGSIENIDLSFLNVGQTTKAEVCEKLKAVDTGVETQHFFVGRWDTSKWGGWVFLVGYGTGEAGAERFWQNANLVVEFDDSGNIKSQAVFPDKFLLEKLQPVAQETKLSAAEHLEVSITKPREPRIPIDVSLSPESVEITQTSKAKKPMHFSVPKRSLKGVRSSLLCVVTPGPVYVTEALQFDTSLRAFGGPREKQLCLEMKVPQLLTLLRYASERGEKALARQTSIYNRASKR